MTQKKTHTKAPPATTCQWVNSLRLLSGMLFENLIEDIRKEINQNGFKRYPTIHLSAAFYRKLKEITPATVYFNLHHGNPKTLLGLPVVVMLDQTRPYQIYITRPIE